MPIIVTVGNVTITISSVAEAGTTPHVSVADYAESLAGDGVKWSTANISASLAQITALNAPRVCCAMGMNRSPTMAILWLWKQSGRPLGEVIKAVEDAYAQLPQRRFSDLVYGLLRDLFVTGRGRGQQLPLTLTYDQRWG